MASDHASVETKHSVLNSSFPVLLPEDEALFMPEIDFQALVKRLLQDYTSTLGEVKADTETDTTGDQNTSNTPDSVSAHTLKRPASARADNNRAQKAPFLAALEKHGAHHRSVEDLAAVNKATTSNSDVTNISSQSALVDLFYDLGENTTSDKLKTLLENAWSDDPLLTLKVIFNARSIHLGKANRLAAYKALAWLAETHPLTLLGNLRWLVRPVIAKKQAEIEDKSQNGGQPTKTIIDDHKQEDDANEDFDMIDPDELDPNKAHDVRYGMSHGYFKDLLNLVVFAANDQLRFDGDPASLLTQRPDKSKEGERKRDWNQTTAKAARHLKIAAQNTRVQQKMGEDPFYRALHVTVARLFAEQLKEDKALLDSGKKSDLKRLSLAAKWSPTFGEFHDKHTFILSTIAEILFPQPASHSPDANNRELYLRHAREHFRKQYASPLRKALGIVERDIAANAFKTISYERVPSLAMDRYTGIFMKKDHERFSEYVHRVASGSAKISGATLLPSTLISKARTAAQNRQLGHSKSEFAAAKAAAELKIQGDVIDGQWNTLVQRVRDAGSLQSSLAVCDVSGSMSHPQFRDGSCPMDSAIGLSLLISEVTAAPFGGGFITFHENPSYLSIADNDCGKGLVDKVRYIMSTPWGYNTNFVSVFEDVILPMAISNKLRQEDMVRQIFVFSDMQFDAAQDNGIERWTSSFDRIKMKYAEAGYEVPRLIFWNLASNSTDKPVTMDNVDTALVSGYSQGMLKAFLETGAFVEEEEITEEVLEGEDEDGMTEVKKVKKKIEPIKVVRKAVEHQGYAMLQILD
ncbi:hypothetical protein FB567DRAFT_196223 [Paraphoma chrysanthemicola]|uniref:Uncharacterized protein n=1 Tax=Paraphoma chrysanthemicola TaxID=798071 RepID=A0A8K0QXE1_9PLEO|nr:hypothetical protein FB567DRAFT_196223 [Paraphoma chrysanthemicola]